MSERRLAKTLARLEAYYDAELKILEGQSYTIGGKTLTRANLSEIRATIQSLENQVAKLEAKLKGKGPRKAYRIMPRDL